MPKDMSHDPPSSRCCRAALVRCLEGDGERGEATGGEEWTFSEELNGQRLESKALGTTVFLVFIFPFTKSGCIRGAPFSLTTNSQI